MLKGAYVFQAFAYDMTLFTPANPHKGKAECFESPRKNLRTQHVRASALIETP